MTSTTKNSIDLKTTKVYEAILRAWIEGKKGIFLEGGTYSSKTYSTLEALMTIAQMSPRNLDINVISVSVPHLKGGCIRDFFRILDSLPENNPFYNQTDRIFKRPDWKGVFSFLSADNEKSLGMRREILFLNEGDTLPWEVAKELISRTDVFVIIDWNPRSEFWAHDYYKEQDVVENGVVVKEGEWDPRWAYDHSTYLDALDVLPPGKRESIEDLGRKDPNYHNIYELGLLGKIEELVHPHYKLVADLPPGDVFYGLDFGFGPFNPEILVGGDPTVLVANVIVGDGLYSKQMIYERRPMTNDDIAREMDYLRVSHQDPIFPDPNEPKSHEELRRKGFTIGITEKGPGSVKFGIKKVNSYYQYITEDSLDGIKDVRNYMYIRRKESLTGREFISDDTAHQWSHFPDARRYAVASHKEGTGRSYPSSTSERGVAKGTRQRVSYPGSHRR